MRPHASVIFDGAIRGMALSQDRGQPPGTHALGALSVIALLILLLAQSVSGTMSSDDLLLRDRFLMGRGLGGRHH
ncbi:MAG: hypothetical protein CM15mP74_07820 [Halieaceae bacterium]|nr:MAG: hypothetical protein CM15mP74_07820 [Halieaceae bacterium]